MWPFNKEHKVELKISGDDSEYVFGVTVKIGDKVKRTEYFSLYSFPSFKRLIRDHRRETLRLRSEIESLRAKTYSSHTTSSQSSIWHVLGCMPTTDRVVVEKAFRRMAMVYHPDHGGSSVALQTLTSAKEKALAKCK